MSEITSVDLLAIKLRAEAATPEPWVVEFDSTAHKRIYAPGRDRTIADIEYWGDEIEVADRTFIAHAREDVPQLLATIVQLLEALEPFAHEEFYKVESRDWTQARAIYDRLAPAHLHPLLGGHDDRDWEHPELDQAK